MNTIDARGKACPEPVLLTMKAIKAEPAGIAVLVDNPCAVENISRFAENHGYGIIIEQNGEQTKLTLNKK